MKLLYVGILLTLFSFFGCRSEDSYRNATVGELKSKIESDTNTVVLDVRTSEELTGELGKLDRIIHIPVQELDNRMNDMNSLKQKDIYIICRSGNRSRKASEMLVKHRFKAINVVGGMKEWRAQFGSANK